MTYVDYADPAHGIAGVPNSTVSYLAGLGYNITYQGPSGSTAHVAVRTKNGTFEAANDPRKAAGAGAALN